MRDIKLVIATYSILFFSISIWIKIYSYGCIANLFFLFFLVVIASSFMDIKVENRNCIKRCYFKENSIFAKILSSKFFIVIFYLISSLLMSISMLYTLINIENSFWYYIAIHIFLTILIFNILKISLKKSIKDRFITIFSREFTINIMAIFIIVAYVYYSLESFEPEYLRDSLNDTLQNASNSIGSECFITDAIFKFQKEIESISWWFVDKNSDQLEQKSYKIAIWLIFIFINSFAMLGINRFIAQIIYIIDKILQKSKDE